tara:strand:+ start:328 stop:501 length:174 start_codon:yes stop_codon:yes gene_type:complete
MNHRELRIRAVNTPGPSPNFAIVIGTSKGRSTAPAIGVNATNHRKIIYFVKKKLKPF